MIRLGFLASLFWLGASVSGLVCADTVQLSNGDRLSGSVDSISGGRLVLQTDYAGRVTIALEKISELSTDNAFDVRVGKQRKSGQFVASAAGQALQQGATSEPIQLTEVRSATLNQTRLPAFIADWESRVDVAAVLSTGNSSTESLNTLIESTYTQERSEHQLALLVSREVAEDATTKDQRNLDYGYKLFLSDRWFASANANYFKDELKQIDMRVNGGAGAGFQFVNNSIMELSTELGLSAVYEEIEGVEETQPAGRWAVDFRRFFLNKRMELFHRQALLFIPSEDRGEVLTSSTGVRFALSDRIDTALRMDLNYETDPPVGNKALDSTYSLGVGFKF